MTHDDVLQKVYACARERGAVFAAEELEGFSPERARRVLAAYADGHYDSGILWEEVPWLLQDEEPDDWPSLNDSYTPQRGLMALAEAGLVAYDGVAADVHLDRAYIHGWNDGMEDTVIQTARRLVGLEPAPPVEHRNR
jgi:hypothetical protein